MYFLCPASPLHQTIMKQHAEIDECSTFALLLVKGLQYPLNSFMTVHNVLIYGVTHGQYVSTSCKVLHVLLKLVDERYDVFSSPDGSAWAELDGLGIAPGTAAIPPRTFADGDDGKNLGQTEKAGCGDVGKHTKNSF